MNKVQVEAEETPDEHGVGGGGGRRRAGGGDGG